MFEKSSIKDSGGTGKAIDISAAAMTPGLLEQWIESSSLKTSLNLIYPANPEEIQSSYGWQDRRLVCEQAVMKESLPEEVITSVLDIPQLLGDGPWLIAASPYLSAITGRFWKAGGVQGFLDAIKLVWSDFISSALEHRVALSEIDCGLLVIPENVVSVSAGPADPSAVEFENLPAFLKKSVFSEAMGEAPLSQVYSFGKLYNRLIQPKDLFEYLQLLSGDTNSDKMKLWRNAATGSGNDDSIRRLAALEMERFLSRKDSPAEFPKKQPAGAGVSLIRQISGYRSSPGIVEAEVWNPSIDNAVPEGRYILAVTELSGENQRFLAGAAGLLEMYGGRGGPGAFTARKAGIPGICEAGEILMLPKGAKVLLNGDNGIATAISVR
jgi:hypothetical protein